MRKSRLKRVIIMPPELKLSSLSGPVLRDNSSTSSVYSVIAIFPSVMVKTPIYSSGNFLGTTLGWLGISHFYAQILNKLGRKAWQEHCQFLLTTYIQLNLKQACLKWKYCLFVNLAMFHKVPHCHLLISLLLLCLQVKFYLVYQLLEAFLEERL